jgi:hypothetical protein
MTVLLWTASYVYDEDGEPDTVMRLYDEDGNLVAENDDMPYRWAETDSSLYFTSDVDGVFYVEVLEWGDWDPDSSANGGAGWDYDLKGWWFDVESYDPEPDNNEPDSALAWVQGDENYLFVLDPMIEERGMWLGDADEAGDIDIYPLTISPPDDTDTVAYDGLYYAYNTWDGYRAAGNVEISFYDEDWNLLSTSQDTSYGVGFRQFYGYYPSINDMGVVAYLEHNGTDTTYYVSVEDVGGAEGVGTGYIGSTGAYYDTLGLIATDNDSGTVDFGGDLSFDEFTDGSGFSGRVGNTLDDGDLLDSWRVSSSAVGGMSGKYVSVFVFSEQMGWGVDAKVSVYGSDGETVLAEATTNDFDGSADPVLVDLAISDDPDSLYVVVEPENGASSLSGNEEMDRYIVQVVVSNESIME